MTGRFEVDSNWFYITETSGNQILSQKRLQVSFASSWLQPTWSQNASMQTCSTMCRMCGNIL